MMTATRWRQRALLAFLTLALIWAQGHGLQHRVEHQRGTHWDGAVSLHGTLAQQGDVHLACAAIDALALGAGPPLATTWPLSAEVTLWLVEVFRQSLLPTAPSAPFEARAPPSIAS